MFWFIWHKWMFVCFFLSNKETLNPSEHFDITILEGAWVAPDSQKSFYLGLIYIFICISYILTNFVQTLMH